MPRHPILILLSLLADAAWISAGLSILGWMLAQHGPLLPYWATLAVLAGAFTLGMLAPTYAFEDGAPLHGQWSVTQSCSGGFAAFVVLMASPATGDGWSVLWPTKLLTGDLSPSQWVGTGVTLFVVLFIWRRGIAGGLEGVSSERVHDSFRIGIAVITIAAIANAVCGCGILDYAVVGVFFGAGLAALALAQLPAEDGKAGLWFKVVCGAVVVVLGGGVLVAYLGSSYGELAASAAGRGWRAIVTVLVDVIGFLLSPLLEKLFDFVTWLRGMMEGSGVKIDAPKIGALGNGESKGIGDVSPSLLAGIQLILLVLLATVLYQGFLRAFRSRFRRHALISTDVRENLPGGEKPLTDFADMLLGLLPQWMRRANAGKLGWHYPRNQGSITGAFMLYFEMLEAAMARGWPLDPTATPLERIDTLESILVGAPIREITACFNDACYGETPSESGTLAALQEALHERLGPESKSLE